MTARPAPAAPAPPDELGGPIRIKISQWTKLQARIDSGAVGATSVAEYVRRIVDDHLTGVKA